MVGRVVGSRDSCDAWCHGPQVLFLSDRNVDACCRAGTPRQLVPRQKRAAPGKKGRRQAKRGGEERGIERLKSMRYRLGLVNWFARPTWLTVPDWAVGRIAWFLR